MFPFGLISNFVALSVFCQKSARQRNSANVVFMTNLAISDICFSTTLPFRLIYYFMECNWIFPDWLCRWCVFAFYVNIYTSILFLTSLSILRYFAVVHPLRSRNLNVRWAKLACFCIWIFVALSSIPFLMSGAFKKKNKTKCFEPQNNSAWNNILQINYLALVLGFLIPFMTILGCYGCIIRSLHAKQGVKSKSKKRSMYLIAVILSTFLLCFVPYHLVRTLHLHAVIEKRSEKELLQKVLVITLCMATSNSCLNPLLYYFAAQNFRKSIVKASRRLTINSFSDSLRKGGTDSKVKRATSPQKETPISEPLCITKGQT